MVIIRRTFHASVFALSVTTGGQHNIKLIDNEHSLWIWVTRYFHGYKCGHFVLVTSKVQGVVTTALENCMTPVKVGLKFCLFRWT